MKVKEVRLSRKHRVERRKKIADLVEFGVTVEAVAQLFGLARGTVYGACKEFGVKIRVPFTPQKIRSHEKRAALRKEIAAQVKSGLTIAAAADKYGVQRTLVYRACKEYSVHLPPRRPLASKTYAVIADLINTSTPESVLAVKYNLSQQRIAQISDECRNACIAMPKRTKPNEQLFVPCQDC